MWSRALLPYIMPFAQCRFLLTTAPKCVSVNGYSHEGALVMTELRIRNVDEWIVDIHRHNAKKKGVSLESEIKRILSDAAFAKRQATAKKLEQQRNELRDKYGVFPSSVDYIRDMREGRV